MVVTRVDTVTSSRSIGVGPCSRWRSWEVSFTKRGEEMVDVRARKGETEVGISSEAKEEEGLLVCWAIMDSERVQKGLRLRAETQYQWRATV